MGALIQGVGGLFQGLTNATAYQAEARQLKEEEATARAAAVQAEAQQRRQLLATIASQDALRAARGGSMTSGTALSIYGDTVSEANKDIATTRLNYLTKADRYRMSASLRRGAATASTVGGYLSLGAGAAGTATDAYSLKLI